MVCLPFYILSDIIDRYKGIYMMNKKLSKQKSGRKYITLGITFILLGLFIIDIIFKGQIYKRLPIRLQNKLSKWIDRAKLECK